MKKNLFTNLKDYNNELEKILERKDFSEDVKNLLLSMLYKIETAYSDYKKIKVNVPEKWQFVEELISEIYSNCRKIEILKPTDLNDIKHIKPIINKEKDEIQVYQNEIQIFKAICEISQNDVLIDDKYYVGTNALKEFFEKSDVTNKLELIRDFDGWTWFRDKSEIENISYNLIYQNLLILFGNNVIKAVISNTNEKIDSIDILKKILIKKYGKDISEKIIYKLIIIISQVYYKQDFLKLENESGKIQKESEETVDKVKFLEQLSTKKKQLYKRYTQIEELLTNKKELEKEFIKRNENEEKIFSINTLVLILEKEKEKIILEIEKLNEKMNPKIFNKRQEELEFKIKLLEDIRNTKLKDNMIEFQKLFIECLNCRLKELNSKKEIIDELYIIRYYNLLNFDNKYFICNLDEILIELNSYQDKLIMKAFSIKVLNKMTSDNRTNLNIIKDLLKSKIIDLEKIEFIIKEKNNNFELEIYDEESLEYKKIINTLTIDKEVKVNKKISLFRLGGRKMKVTFLGAAQTVTGSNFLVEGAGRKFLVDCGMYQGKATDELKNEDEFEFNINEIDFMLLTHAHIDHSGRIPKLYNEGYRNPIYAHKATCDLCAIMLPDSGHIQEMEIEWKNRKRQRKGEPELPPLYTAEEAAKCLEIFQPLKYDEIIEIDENIHVRYNDAGHMLGSAIIEIWIKENEKEEKIVFTGDIGNNDIPLLAEPTMIEDADYLVMESTYGNRRHIKSDSKAEDFLRIVSETLEKGGTVVIPSFAVGRTQEILFELDRIKEQEKSEKFKKEYEELMNTPVYVDSPLAISATEVFEDNMNLFDEETQKVIQSGENPLEFPGLQFTRTAEESKALNESNEPCIVISASGMCEVGRIKHHLKHNLWNPNNTILFVGYQAKGTLGDQIVNGAKSVKIFGEDIAVNARIEYLEGYSGHADQEGLLNFVYSYRKKPKHIFLVHGEPESQEELKNKIIETTSIPVAIPKYGETYDLENEVQITDRIEIKKQNPEKYLRLKVLNRLDTLKDEITDMEEIVKEDLRNENIEDNQIQKLDEKIKELELQIVRIIDN